MTSICVHFKTKKESVQYIEGIMQRFLIDLALEMPMDIQRRLRNIEFSCEFEDPFEFDSPWKTGKYKEVFGGIYSRRKVTGGIYIGRFNGILGGIILSRIDWIINMKPRIILFSCPYFEGHFTERKLIAEIRSCLLHEIGHALKMNHRQLKEMGLGGDDE